MLDLHSGCTGQDMIRHQSLQSGALKKKKRRKWSLHWLSIFGADSYHVWQLSDLHNGFMCHDCDLQQLASCDAAPHTSGPTHRPQHHLTVLHRISPQTKRADTQSILQDFSVVIDFIHSFHIAKQKPLM